MGFESNADFLRGVSSIHDWVNQFTFSRVTKNTARDFSDAVLLAEILVQLTPAWVQLHNYPTTHRFQQKLSNWETLNRKVLHRLKCEISRKHQEDLANAVPGAIELLLIQVKRATASSPFVQANRESEAVKSPRKGLMPRRRSFTAAECLSPRREKEKPPKEPSKTGNDSHSTVERFSEQEAIATSFSKLLQLISGDKEDSIEGYDTPMHPNARNRADTVPVDSTRQRNVTRKSADRLWTPNYAKPTQSTAAGTRHAIVGTKQRPHLTSRIKFKANKPLEDLQPNRDHQETNRQEEDAKHLPSNTNEFQEDSFVFFLCGEPSPTSSGYDNRDESSERAQVARVVKTLPSGECLLQLYKREPSRDSPRAMPTRKIRCYSPTPHFVDCCSSQLHSIQSMVCDRQTDRCEWHLLSPESNTSGRTELPSKSTSAADWSPSRRHFYVEVLARITCSPANLAAPMIVTSTKTISPASCRQCPSFSVTFSVPAAPTVFPTVYVNLVSSPPDRFPIRSQLTRRNCVK